jgi:hypothetical protein
LHANKIWKVFPVLCARAHKTREKQYISQCKTRSTAQPSQDPALLLALEPRGKIWRLNRVEGEIEQHGLPWNSRLGGTEDRRQMSTAWTFYPAPWHPVRYFCQHATHPGPETTTPSTCAYSLPLLRQNGLHTRCKHILLHFLSSWVTRSCCLSRCLVLAPLVPQISTRSTAQSCPSRAPLPVHTSTALFSLTKAGGKSTSLGWGPAAMAAS